MHEDRFYELVEEMHAEEVQVMRGKGKEYTKGNKDKLANFKRIAEKLGVSADLVWAVYFMKHLDSQENYLAGGEISSGETIYSRVTDLRNYLILYVAILKEREEQETNCFCHKTEQPAKPITPNPPVPANNNPGYAIDHPQDMVKQEEAV